MKHLFKRLVFGSTKKPRRIWFGAGAGCRLMIDPAVKAQRIVGLDEAEISPALKRFIPHTRTFIDIGASDGYYPVLALKRNPGMTAVGCEPQVSLAEVARTNYSLNFPTGGPVLEWVEKFVGDGTGQVSLDELGQSRPGPVFLKIDVDGHEVNVLGSGRRLLERADCRVLVEVHSAELEVECIALLSSLGYSCTIIKNAWWRTFIPEHRPIALNRWVLAVRAAPS